MVQVKYKKIIDRDATDIFTWVKNEKIIYVTKRFKGKQKEMKKDINMYRELGFQVVGVMFI